MKSILQTKEWGSFKKSLGFEIIVHENLFIHKRNLPFGQNFLYLPEVSAQDVNAKNIDDLKSIVKQEKSIFLRLELVDEFTENAHKLLMSFGFKKAFEEVQPKWRQILELNQTRGELLAQMKQKGRYNVKLAERKGVKINKYKIDGSDESKKALKTFFNLYENTSDTKKLGSRSYNYFINLAEHFKGSDLLEIYIGSFQGEPLAGALISYADKTASYLYGGSSANHREVMAPYLMHWQIICDAKERGFEIYDFIGRSNPNNETSKWAGVTKFKEQFGGRALEILGSYDLINKPILYKAFRSAEKLRRKNP